MSALKLFVRNISSANNSPSLPATSLSRWPTFPARSRAGHAGYTRPNGNISTSTSYKALHTSPPRSDAARADIWTADLDAKRIEARTEEQTQKTDVTQNPPASDSATGAPPKKRPKKTLREKKREQKAKAIQGGVAVGLKADTEKRQKQSSKPAKDTRQTPKDQAPKAPKESWRVQKEALEEKFPEGWQPRKKLSPDALAGIRALHQQFPEDYTTEVLAQKFKVSPEAIRRILRSKWTPSTDEEIDRQERWFERGKKVWARYAELGMKPPRKWRKEGIVRKPFWNERKQRHRVRVRDDGSRSEKARLEAQKKLSENLM